MFKELKPSEISENPFKLIGKQWMLITAGTEKSFNTMTASWGGLGVIWNKNVATCYIRPQRYTYDFVEREDYFTLAFFDEKYRSALNLCGAKSGRDIDKMSATGLTPVFDEVGIYYKEASVVLICRKLYFNDLNPDNFLDSAIEKNYTNKDYHRMYIGEIVKVLVK